MLKWFRKDEAVEAENVVPMMDRRRKAVEARAIFENPVFKEAVNVVKEYHTKVFLRANATDAEVLEARERIRALTEVANQLVKFMTDEKMAEQREKHRG